MAHEWDCVVCGAHVVGRIRGRRGTKCQAHSHWKPADCGTCGERIYSANRTTAGRTVYCSTECKPSPRKQTREPKAPSSTLRWRQCKRCDGWMCRPSGVYCGQACAAEVKRYQDREGRRKPPQLVKCNYCRIGLGYVQRKVCDTCQARLRRAHKGNHRARARRFGVEYEAINALKVYIRDGWQCGLCHKPVDKRLKWPSQMCASLDHTVPMSKGGGHTYANTRCAHWLCNTLKSDRGSGEQLALVG